MTKNTKKIQDLSHGDVIKYTAPTGKEQKGIVYQRLGNAEEGLKGFRVIPLRTVGRKVKVNAPKGTEIWTTNKTHLLANFGGDSAKQQAVLYYDLRRISKDSVVFSESQDKCKLIGNISGNDLAGIYQHVERLSENGKLKINGSIITPDTKITIIPAEIIRRQRELDIAGRNRATINMARRANPAGVPNAEVLTQRFNRMSLGEAVEQGYISPLTQNIVSTLVMPEGQERPKTLGELFDLDINIISQSRGGINTAKGKAFKETADTVIRNIEQAKRYLRM